MNPQRDPYLPYTKDPRVLVPFEENKLILRDLYLKQNLHLKQVKEIMEGSHSFPQFDISWYENILQNHLGLRKNLKRDEWASVNYHIEKRKRNGVASEVFLCGIKKRNDRRRQKLPQINRQRLSRSPSLPRGVTIRIPTMANAILPRDSTEAKPQTQSNSTTLAVRPREKWTPKQYKTSPWWSVILENSPAMEFIYSIQHLASPALGASKFEVINFGSLARTLVPPINVSHRQTGMIHIPRAHLDDASILLRACLTGANGAGLILLDRSAVSLEQLFEVTSEPRNYNSLKALFSLDLLVVTSFWGQLIGMCCIELEGARWERFRLNQSKTVKTLALIGLEVQGGKLVRLYNLELLEAVIISRHEDSAVLLERLIRRGVSPNVDQDSTFNLPPLVLSWRTSPSDAAKIVRKPELLDKIFSLAAGLVWSIWTDRPSLKVLLQILLRRCTRIKSQDLACVTILLQARSNVDGYLAADYDHPYSKKTCPIDDWFIDDGDDGLIKPVYMVDGIFDGVESENSVAERFQLYVTIHEYSRRLQHSLTIPGVLSAAFISTESIHKYLAARNLPRHEKNATLELALLKATRIPGLHGMEIVRRILETGTDPDVPHLLELARESPGWQGMPTRRNIHPSWHPIWVAAYEHNIGMLKILIKHGANLNICNCLAAVAEGAMVDPSPTNTPAVLSLLAEEGADIAGFGGDAMLAMLRLGKMPPEWIWNTKDFSPDNMAYAWFRDHGVELGAPLIRKTLLERCMFSDKGCSLQLVEFLISKGLLVRSVLQKDHTMLSAVLRSGSSDRISIVDLLLDHGADCTVDLPGGTVLESLLRGYEKLSGVAGYFHQCTYRKEKERMDMLTIFTKMLRCGARTDGDELLALLIMSTGPLEAVHDIALTLEQGDSLVLETVETGAKINGIRKGRLQFSEWETSSPLVTAIKVERFELARELIRRGADMNMPSSKPYGRTPLQQACGRESGREVNLDFINYLLDAGAEINAPAHGPRGLTSLQAAASSGSRDVISLLLDRGAEVNATNENDDNRDMEINDGNWYITALDQASGQGRLEVAYQLVEAGGWSGKRGETGFDGAIELADKARHFAISEMLRKKAETEGPRLRLWDEVRTKFKSTDIDDMIVEYERQSGESLVDGAYPLASDEFRGWIEGAGS